MGGGRNDSDPSPAAAGDQPHFCPEASNTWQLLTGPGAAAIAVVRITGPATGLFLTCHVQPRAAPAEPLWRVGQVKRARLIDGEGAVLDDILVSVHGAAPAWDIRLHLHGNPWLLATCANLLAASGFADRSAAKTVIGPACLWPSVDRVASEAYDFLPSILTLRGAGLLLGQLDILRATVSGWLQRDDWPRVQAECAAAAEGAALWQWFTAPARIALVGPPNAGKSTLLNALTDTSASIVSPVAGTTRDWVDVPGECGGFPVVWIDTAGLRQAGDALERAGMEASNRAIEAADALVVVLDADPGVRALQESFLSHLDELLAAAGAARERRYCFAVNKCDLARSAAEAAAIAHFVHQLQSRTSRPALAISARTRARLDELPDLLWHRVLCRALRHLHAPCAFTTRQCRLLRSAAQAHSASAGAGFLRELLGQAGSS